MSETTFKFGDQEYPYEDATENIPFRVTEKDVAAATMRDPNHCVAACAVRRQYTRAYFRRDTAVLLYPNEKGEVTAKRYRFTNRLKKAIHAFDADGTPFPLGIYELLAPTPSQTLAAQRLRKRKPSKSRRRVRPHTVFISRGTIPATLT